MIESPNSVALRIAYPDYWPSGRGASRDHCAGAL